MKYKHYISIVAAALYLLLQVSCSNAFYSSSNVLGQIKQGMSPQEITQLLGKPEYRRLDYDIEEWEYRKKLNFLDSEETVIIIRFENERLIYLDSFKARERQPQTPVASVTPPPPSPVVIGIERPSSPIGPPMSDNRFEEFYDDAKSYIFKSEQMQFIRSGVKNKRFTCRQCARMMSLFTFDDDKFKIIKIFAPYLTDKENYDVITDYFLLSSDREKVLKALGIRKV